MKNLIEHLLCKTLEKERQRVNRNLNRARERNLPATLTIFEWIGILDHFKFRCAYCKRAPAETMEHVIAMRHGGGTTACNCIPLCTACHETQNTLESRAEAAVNRLKRIIS